MMKLPLIQEQDDGGSLLRKESKEEQEPLHFDAENVMKLQQLYILNGVPAVNSLIILIINEFDDRACLILNLMNIENEKGKMVGNLKKEKRKFRKCKRISMYKCL